jgi:hypothetical protein
MNRDILRGFLNDIANYRSVWRSARISGLAVSYEGTWVSLGLRVSLSELPPQPMKIIGHQSSPHFIYFDGRCPAEHFDQAAEELVNGRYLTVQPNYSVTGGSLTRIYLNRNVAQALARLDEEHFRQHWMPVAGTGPSWSSLGFQRQGLLPPSFGTDRAGFALFANGDRTVEVLSYADQRRVDGKLRAGEPPVDGFEGLMRCLLPGVNPRYDGGEAHFQIVAPLPFFLECREAGHITVRAPSTTPHNPLGVRFFFRPDHLAAPPKLTLHHNDSAPVSPDMIAWTHQIPWPEGSATGKACLFFLNEEIGSLEVSRWPAGASLRAALDDYFDPERRKLLQGLGLYALPRGHKLQARQFEAAVARLMGLLGLEVTWYGDLLAIEQRPDLGGVAKAGEKSMAILAECTLSKPEGKFSELHKRTKELTVTLGTEAKVLAMVFTPAPTTPSEADRAAEHEITLVGPDGLQQLVEAASSCDTASKAIELLENIRNSANPASLGE